MAPYESELVNQSDWKRSTEAVIHRAWKGALSSDPHEALIALANCVRMQEQLGCEAIILPSPLTADQDSNLNVEMAWLDLGMAVSSKEAPNVPRLATVALSDASLRGVDPWKNQLLDVLIDQITARGPEGVYLVVEQANEQGYYCSHPNTIGAILRLAYEFRSSGLSRVVVGQVGTAGLLALAAGADTWSAGWYKNERCLRFADLEDREGRAIPTYYSHALASEIHTEEDLSRFAKLRLFARIEDETPASSGLLRALRAGQRR
ncbi:MAG: hypothetical protein EOP84_34000, partial [Verrucomicrobiaceae bacterium]